LTISTERILLVLVLSALAAPSWGQGTYTANSCNYSDVNAIINGPTHTAVSGDIIQIPSGTCTWTSGLSFSVGITVTGSGTPNNTPGTFGSGTLNTVIIDNYASGPVFQVTNLPYGQTVSIGLLDIEPYSASTGLWSPFSIQGTCTSSGCPNIRLDNIGFGITTHWNEAGNSAQAETMIRLDGVFGVVDHCTMPSGTSASFLNINHSAYLGVGTYGDNSWAQPDSFGGANVLYFENNVIYTSQWVSDGEFAPSGGATGGGRQAGRFNQVTFTNGNTSGFGTHGLDTGGRTRSGRQIEVYGNTVTCLGFGCGLMTAYRGGTGFTFGNSITANYPPAWLDSIAILTTYRRVLAAGPWGYCGGSGVYDTNDGITYYSGTMTTSGSGVLTMTDSSKSWTTNKFTPTGAPYSVYDTTQGFWAEIASNTSDTITIVSPISESGWTGFNNGDSYEVLRATVCVDQPGRGQGNYESGSTPSPAAPVNEALDPVYEFADSFTGDLTGNHVGSLYGNTVANRDWYTDNGGAVQSSPTSPFNGTSGVGHGTLANRPATCTAGPGGNTPGVGYWATDQGSWNNSGNAFGNGELFVCTATNTWTLYYTPYTYPHPLTLGTGTGTGTTGSNPPAAPTVLRAIAK